MKTQHKHYHANSSFPSELFASIIFTLAILAFAIASFIFSPVASADDLDDELKWLCAERTSPKCPK